MAVPEEGLVYQISELRRQNRRVHGDGGNDNLYTPRSPTLPSKRGPTDCWGPSILHSKNLACICTPRLYLTSLPRSACPNPKGAELYLYFIDLHACIDGRGGVLSWKPPPSKASKFIPPLIEKNPLIQAKDHVKIYLKGGSRIKYLTHLMATEAST